MVEMAFQKITPKTYHMNATLTYSALHVVLTVRDSIPFSTKLNCKEGKYVYIRPVNLVIRPEKFFPHEILLAVEATSSLFNSAELL